jgi:hypothetical protein
LTPSLPRSVGFLPVFFPPERGLGHRPVGGQPLPVDPLAEVVLQQAGLPQLEEHAGPHPLLEAVVGGGALADPGRVQGLPLAARAQDEEDPVHAGPVGDAGPAAAEAVGVHPGRQEHLQVAPERVRDPPAVVRPPLRHQTPSGSSHRSGGCVGHQGLFGQALRPTERQAGTSVTGRFVLVHSARRSHRPPALAVPRCLRRHPESLRQLRPGGLASPDRQSTRILIRLHTRQWLLPRESTYRFFAVFR